MKTPSPPLDFGWLSAGDEAELESFRIALCEFITARIAGSPPGARDRTEYLGWSKEFRKSFRADMGEAGYLGVSWSAEFGGGGKDPRYQLSLVNELEMHDAPALEPATTYMPSIIMEYGTDAQRQRFLPALRRGELSFFLGYSEPEAGSDLASLQATATPDNHGYRLTGQKWYSSWADGADWGLVAAREPGTSRHDGISLFLVDMSLPGIQVRLHPTIAGFRHPAVYFDHVTIAEDSLLGPLGGGWRSLMRAVDYERLSLSSTGLLERQFSRLLGYVSPPGGSTPDALGEPPESLATVPGVLDELVSLAIELEASALYTMKMAHQMRLGRIDPAPATLAILLKREAGARADTSALDLMGPAGQLEDDSADAGSMIGGYFERLYFRFAAGGFDVSRNVLARRALELR